MINSPEFQAAMTLNGYFGLKLVGDKICGLHDYYTTRGIVVGLSVGFYERRYCYKDREEALQALAEWNGTTDHPPGNWVKLKGTWNGEPVDMFNPDWIEQ